MVQTTDSTKRYWLILSYRANIDGSACSQHLDDRLPFFEQQGITPILLTGPVGSRFADRLHVQCHSIAPSGIRFEVRHFLRKRFKKRWQFKLVETLLLLPVFPFYLLEKILINLESEWSWFFLASLRGIFLCRGYAPEAVYSTGGSASAHVAALIINRWVRLPWVAETQDPLVHDHDWQRGRLVLRIYRRLEKKICIRATSFVFLTRAAMENTARRTGIDGRGAAIYPGSNPDFFQTGRYHKGTVCHFAHFGSLAGTRNLVVFFQALYRLVAGDETLRRRIRIDVYGSLDSASEKEMVRLQLADLVVNHGAVARKDALAAMQQADCLLLIQNTIFFSSETIPSKVYEYLLCGRPILGLVHHNEELTSMLVDNDHFSVPADDVDAVAEALQRIVTEFIATDFTRQPCQKIWTVEEAVQQVVVLGRKGELRA
ncbi:MAG: glycosyltransferase [Desulfobulbaceae bacterium]|nr:glycosyltransferase [Desulfobulbaceae bacterium]